MTETSTSEPATRILDLAELKKHTSETDCYLLYNGKVYDVTEFLDEHPGGYDIILNVTGRDATEDFDEIGHSNSAREMLDKYLLGDFVGTAEDAKKPKVRVVSATAYASSSPSALQTAFRAALPLLVVLIAVYFAFLRK